MRITAGAVSGLVTAALLALAMNMPAYAEEHGSENYNTQPTSYGLHVPWAAPHDRYMADGTIGRWAGEWPTIPVKNIRLWDSHTTWTELQPAPHTFIWDDLDANVAIARQHGTTDIILVVSGTPTWAATRHTQNSANWIGKDSASPPKLAAWTEYLTALVQRYKGRISAYEIWNEPNNKLFWQGTPAQLAVMVDIAHSIINKYDPAALIIAPAPLISSRATYTSALPYWKALASHGWNIDVASTHIYPETGKTSTDFEWLIDESMEALTKLGWHGRHWITEINYQTKTGNPVTNKKAYTLVTQTMERAHKYVQRIYWYAWTVPDNGYQPALLFRPGTGAAKALLHY